MLGLGMVTIKTDGLGFPIHDAIAPGFLSSFFNLPESDVEDPKALSVQKLLFSATLTRNPAKIASLQLSDPQYVAVQEVGEDGEEKQKYTTPAGLTVRKKSFGQFTQFFFNIVCHDSSFETIENLLHYVRFSFLIDFLGTYDRLRNIGKAFDGPALTASSSSPIRAVFYEICRICASSVQVNSAL